MVGDRHDEAKSVALVKQALDLVPIAIEGKHLVQRGKLDVGEEVLALLEDSNGEGLFDEGLIFLKIRHELDSLAERLATLLADLEGRLLELDELE